MECRLCERSYQDLADDRTQAFVEEIGYAIGFLITNLFYLYLLLTAYSDSAIKKKCCIDCPIPTQVILKKSVTSKNIPSIATEVAIQLNCKIGEAP